MPKFVKGGWGRGGCQVQYCSLKPIYVLGKVSQLWWGIFTPTPSQLPPHPNPPPRPALPPKQKISKRNYPPTPPPPTQTEN